MSDTFHRHFSMLRLIPRQPGGIDTSTMVRKLENLGFAVTPRSVQRDLDKLSRLFPLVCNDSAKPYRWSWMQEAAMFDVPSLNPQTAVTLELAYEFLQPLLPRSSLRYLKPHVDRAREVLKDLSSARLASWPSKIRLLGRGLPLGAPAVRADVVDVVYTALLEERRFKARYRRRKDRKIKDYVVNPLGLVIRPPLVYLVCSFRDYDDIMQMVLHRMTKAELLDEPRKVPKRFNLDRYIQEGAFGFPVAKGTIRLVALFEEQAALPLQEATVGRNQKVSEQSDGRTRLETTVPDTVELRAWLRGFGDLVEVLKPASLRREFRATAERMTVRYGASVSERAKPLKKAQSGFDPSGGSSLRDNVL